MCGIAGLISQDPETRIGAMLGIKEYPAPSSVGMFDRLLSAPFAFVLTQSFTLLAKASGQALLQRQFYRMGNAGDFAISQAEDLKKALDALTSNEFVMGDHHFSLQILADVDDRSVGDSGSRRLGQLIDHVAQARSILAETGMTVAREDLAMEAAFWAQLPGNFPMRARKAPITSRNFAAMAPFHNYPAGREKGNHWGDALALFMTSAHSPYYFSLHASDPADPDGGSRKDTGHTFLCGPTGSGKTVLIGFQCDGYTGKWAYNANHGSASNPKIAWVSKSGTSCNPRSWAQNKWHHVQASFYRSSGGTVTYHSIWLDGVETKLNVQQFAGADLNWDPVIVTQFQVDGLGSSGTVTAYLDSLSISAW